MTRQVYVDHKKKCLLFWSQKSGCTSLRRWFLYGYLGVTKDDIKKHTYEYLWLMHEGYRIPYDEAVKLQGEGYMSVVLTRHPASRILSSYLNKFVVREDGELLSSFEALESFTQDQLVAWGRAPKVGEPYTGLSFREFLTILEHAVAAATGGYPDLNPHWNIQAPFVDLKACPPYDKYLHVEAFPETIKWLNGYFGADYVMPYHNKTPYGQGGADRDLADISSLELTKCIADLKKENFLSRDTLAQIERIYATDYALFGYKPYDLKYIPE